MKNCKRIFWLFLLFPIISCCWDKTNSKSKCECDSACICDTMCKCVGDSICQGKCGCVKKDSVDFPQSAIMFFDASGSMEGYLKASKEPRFKGAIASLFSVIPNIQVYMYGVKADTSAMSRDIFLDKLNAREIKYQDESNLTYMIKSMLDSKYDVSFLVTDGIMSGSDTQISANPTYNIDNREAMSEQINSLVKEYGENKTALVIRALSNFSGTYYPYYNVPSISLSDVERPFFIICIGENKYVKVVDNELKKKDDASSWYVVMLGDDYLNSFRLSRSEGTAMKGDKLIYTGDSCLFTAKIDSLPQYMRKKDYLQENLVFRTNKTTVDKSKYKITVKANKVSVKMVRLSQLTDGGTLYYELRYRLPEWIDKYSSDDDSNIKTDTLARTFNLKYFIKGLSALNKASYVTKGKLEFTN